MKSCNRFLEKKQCASACDSYNWYENRLPRRQVEVGAMAIDHMLYSTKAKEESMLLQKSRTM